MTIPANQDRTKVRVAVVGGGASGFFAALTVKELNPMASVSIFERSSNYLSKVKISGGGRCNATHECYDPDLLAREHYPRGAKELRAAFYRWQPSDTINWFAQRSVELKAEPDGRMFPVSNQSQTIIDCFMNEASKAGIELFPKSGVQSITINSEGVFILELSSNKTLFADAVCVAIGSLKQSSLSNSLTTLGHKIETLAPSLFAFNVQDARINGLAGLSVQDVEVIVEGSKTIQSGPLLITHKGLSGPAILKTSAWEARNLLAQNYHFKIRVNWVGGVAKNQLREKFSNLRIVSGKSKIRRSPFEEIPKRLWSRFIAPLNLDPELSWTQFPKDKEKQLIEELTDGIYEVRGKTTNKEIEQFTQSGKTAQHYPEFVTCGGISLKEIDFRTMESRRVPNLHFVGECLDIDGITGGFNFQSCWTTGRIAGVAIASKIQAKDTAN